MNAKIEVGLAVNLQIRFRSHDFDLSRPSCPQLALPMKEASISQSLIVFIKPYQYQDLLLQMEQSGS